MAVKPKGNEWYFGMKAHIGADADSCLVHSVHATVANESSIANTLKVLHGQEEFVSADAGYVGIEKREEIVQAQQHGKLGKDVQWLCAAFCTS